MHALDFHQAVARLCHHAASGGARALIALAGVPGSGKSTLAARLAEAVNRRVSPHAMAALGMDGFHLPKAALRQMANPEEALARRGAPWTFDAAGLAARLALVRQSGGVVWCAWPDFQHGVGDPVERQNAVRPETRVILVEGLYLIHRADGWEAVAAAFDERWYLDTPLTLAMQRLARRHMASWSVTADQAEARIARNDRLNAEIVIASQPAAEWFLRGDAPLDEALQSEHI